MNVKGSKHYSKQTSVMRNSDGKIDQHLKLTFVYPMMFDKSMQKYKPSIRDFVSATFLREIFTSNFLNLVSMSSQISTISDEKGKETNLTNSLGDVFISTGSNDSNNFLSNFSNNQDKYELQRQIKEKTKQVKAILKTDPLMKKLDPKVQVISLENLMEVPVVVGTAPMDVDTKSLMMILLVAVATNTPLNKYSNVKKIVNKIKNTKENDLVNLLQTSANMSLKERFADWLEKDTWTPTGVKKLIKKTNKFGQREVTGPHSDILKQDILKTNNDEMYLSAINTAQSGLDETDLYFKFFLQKDMLKRRYGVDTTTNLKTTVTNLSPRADEIFEKMISNFNLMMSKPAASLLRSISNLLWPLNTQTTLNFDELFRELITKEFTSNIENFIKSDVIPDITSATTEKIVSDNNNDLNILKNLCKSVKKESKNIKKYFDIIKSHEILFVPKINHNGDEQTNKKVREEVFTFIMKMEKMSAEVQGQNKMIYQKLSKVSNNTQNLSDTLNIIVKDSVLSFINEITKYTDSNIKHAIEDVNSDIPINQLKTGIIYWLQNILEFLFLINLQTAICDYINIVDVEIESAKNEVTEFPNYTLVLPVEVIYALHSAYKAKNLNRLFEPVESAKVGPASKREFNITDNYVKGMVNYIGMKLKVPNLIIIDERKNDVYYKMMHMSAVNKTKINTLDTFSKLIFKSQDSGSVY